jgi:hypothetical protein
VCSQSLPPSLPPPSLYVLLKHGPRGDRLSPDPAEGETRREYIYIYIYIYIYGGGDSTGKTPRRLFPGRERSACRSMPHKSPSPSLSSLPSHSSSSSLSSPPNLSPDPAETSCERPCKTRDTPPPPSSDPAETCIGTCSDVHIIPVGIL